MHRRRGRLSSANSGRWREPPFLHHGLAAGEANAIHRAVYLWDLNGGGDLVADGSILGDVDGFASKTLRLRKALGDEIAHDHDCGTQ